MRIVAFWGSHESPNKQFSLIRYFCSCRPLSKPKRAVLPRAPHQERNTHHNQLKQDLYLRISFELYLKRLLVGMIDGVYEIGRDFRNEGVDRTHNPEFTQIEWYKAYIDYHGVMDITERMITAVAQEVLGTTAITFQEHGAELSGHWRRVTLRDAILEFSGIDYAQYPDAGSLSRIMRERGKNPRPDSTWGKLVDSLLNTDVEPNLIQPTFILDYPRDGSPLAKMTEHNPAYVERFEFFIRLFWSERVTWRKKR